MKIKALICNCRGSSPSFQNSDMNTLPFQVESSGLDVDYVAVHPQLCGVSGSKVMEDVLRAAEDDSETFVVVGACELQAQRKLFQKTLRKTGFDQGHIVAVDIRDATNEGILDRLRKRIEEQIHSQQRGH